MESTDRNWQLRFVKDFGKIFWLGVSVENPATLTAGNIPGTVNGVVALTARSRQLPPPCTPLEGLFYIREGV